MMVDFLGASFPVSGFLSPSVRFFVCEISSGGKY